MRTCVSCRCVSGQIDTSGRCPFCADPIGYPAPLPERPVARPVGRVVLDAVAEALDVPVAAICGPRRRRPIVLARWAIMQILTDGGWSTTAVGKLLGRDHTTVVHGLEQIKPALRGEDGDALRMALDAGREAADDTVSHSYCGPPIVMVWGDPQSIPVVHSEGENPCVIEAA